MCFIYVQRLNCHGNLWKNISQHPDLGPSLWNAVTNESTQLQVGFLYLPDLKATVKIKNLYSHVSAMSSIILSSICRSSRESKMFTPRVRQLRNSWWHFRHSCITSFCLELNKSKVVIRQLMKSSIQLLHYITVITVQIYSKSFQMLVCSVC